MPHRTTAIVLAVLAAVAASGCTRDGGGGPAVPAALASPFVVVDPASTSPTDRAIAAAQDRLRTDGGDDGARLALAGAFLQKARETGDPSLYTRVEVLLERAAGGRGEDATLLVAEGTLALARHRFADALDLGRRAVDLAPGNVGAMGVVVDALNELGRYDEALEATQAMADAKPNLASPFVVVDPASTSPTDRAIAAAQDRLRTDGGDDG
ncbi:MAG: tetratricopeptide repeat protein, partial [Acidimicrobiales bacterium]